MRLERLPKITPDVPTCSMSDIAFLLNIFFMLTTVFISVHGFPVTLPKAVSTKKVPSKNIVQIWVSTEGVISIDDNIVKSEFVGRVVAKKIAINPDIIISILMDKDSEYGMLSDIFEQLKEAGALKVSLTTLKEEAQ
ncbi:MAG: biopolymer transporter ExbD [Candidatus Stahlbacteria bacterium]|nr:biopolymer transporter ExbD [Candidatus Stahlbacteria bacterium]